MTKGVPTTVGGKRARWQFSLRSMFVLTLSAAALAAIARVAAQLDVLVVGVAAALWSTRGMLRNWRRRRFSIPSAVILALSWCALYIVSVGPAIIVADCFVWTSAPLTTFYAPLDWTYQHTPLAKPLEWYVEFWMSVG